MRRFIPFLLALLIFPFTTASGQDGASAVINQPQITEFPVIKTSLIVRDANGDFVGGLTASDITVVENDQRLEASEFMQLSPGGMFAVALNPGRSFAIRDGNGISRYDNIRSALVAWAEAETGESDSLSLLVNNGPQIIHTNSRSDWLDTLLSYQEDPRHAVPGLDVLSRAVDVVSDDTPVEGMGRAILFITPVLQGDLTVGLKNLAVQAEQSGIQISIWLVAPQDALESRGALQLKELADTTGGGFFHYTGTEVIPDPEQYLAPLRDVYLLAYQSRAVAGEYTVSVEINKGDLSLATEPRKFTLNLLPPVPVVIDPPGSILRETRESEDEGVLVKLVPEYQDLELLIQYPDGIRRPIISSTLYVDGSPAAIQTDEPFDRFRWDLRGYLGTADHLIRIEVVDSQGMVGTSADLPVRIDVVQKMPSALRTVSRNMPWFAGIFTLLACAVTLLALIITGRIKPCVPGQIAGNLTRSKNRMMNRKASAAISAVRELDVRERVSRFARIHWPKRRVVSDTFAHLIRLTDAEKDGFKEPLPITNGTMIIGSDRLQCDLVFDDPSIEPVHAKLVREGNNLYLVDSGSTAGTWINYKPVSSEGAVLEHGDIIHIGRVALRLKLREPSHIRKPVVIREEQES